MMDCQRCGSAEANVQFTEVVGTRKEVQWLCEPCAANHGLAAPAAPEPTPVLPSPDPALAARLRVRCPECGTSLGTVRRSGRVGCPRCYQTFREHLDPLLERVHGAVSHLGRRPEAGDQRTDTRRRLRRLQADLGRAVDQEDFEAAARLRDQIAALETDPASRESEG